MSRTASKTIALPALPPVARLLVGLGLTLARMDDRRRTRRALSHLDAHLLRDIGLTDTVRASECGKAPWVD
ncbi:DUF1127 domain-containing protein [Rhodobacter sp. Har01]|uniref:DUF1127 domain-containing protein n=1 Tax=Rhodobacter sp. Har01 TaxID=2883999 RepID=UPI001D063EA5|nr:DUF1127 domain-containing protein [Rhodobacter sp. Har01]MCB6177066.1 DUF1127 domain-containing protein [Rhodobacter sp. Har01]